MKIYEKFLEFLATSLLIIVGIFGTLVSVLDFIGNDFENGPWRWIKGPLPVILLIVAVLALAVGLERMLRLKQLDRKLDSIEHLLKEGSANIIHALGGVSVRTFSSTKEFFDYVSERHSEAKIRIEDLTWGDDEPNFSVAEEKSYQKYLKSISSACNRGVSYREVMSFSDKHYVDRAKNILAKKLVSYNLKYFELKQSVPVIGFSIVDSEEVFFGFYRWPYLSAEQEIKLAIRHPEIIRLFQDYFDTIWTAAQPIKVGDKIDELAFSKIEQKFMN